jgi:hypothetical protein
MHDNEAESTTRLQDFARSHTTRANILALFAQDEGRSLDPETLGRDLPNEPAPAVVSYHLKTLRMASLLPPQASKKNGGSAPSPRLS